MCNVEHSCSLCTNSALCSSVSVSHLSLHCGSEEPEKHAACLQTAECDKTRRYFYCTTCDILCVGKYVIFFWHSEQFGNILKSCNRYTNRPAEGARRSKIHPAVCYFFLILLPNNIKILFSLRRNKNIFCWRFCTFV